MTRDETLTCGPAAGAAPRGHAAERACAVQSELPAAAALWSWAASRYRPKSAGVALYGI